MTDIQMLETQVRTLEKDLRLARQTLRDQFAMAALTGILAKDGLHPDYVHDLAKAAFDVANVALEVRKCPA